MCIFSVKLKGHVILHALFFSRTIMSRRRRNAIPDLRRKAWLGSRGSRVCVLISDDRDDWEYSHLSKKVEKKRPLMKIKTACSFCSVTAELQMFAVRFLNLQMFWPEDVDVFWQDERIMTHRGADGDAGKRSRKRRKTPSGTSLVSACI